MERAREFIERRGEVVQELVAERERLQGRVAEVEGALRELGWKRPQIGRSTKPKPKAKAAPTEPTIRERVLAVVREEPGSTAAEIAVATGLASAQVHTALKPLRDDGLIRFTGERGAQSYFVVEKDENGASGPLPGSTGLLS